MAVWRRSHDSFSGNIAASARPILHDEWLTESLRQPLPNQACEDVISTAWRKADNNPHRPRRIGLRRSDARNDRECGGARGQMQELPSVGKFHVSPSAAVIRCERARIGISVPETAGGQCRLLAH